MLVRRMGAAELVGALTLSSQNDSGRQLCQLDVFVISSSRWQARTSLRECGRADSIFRAACLALSAPFPAFFLLTLKGIQQRRGFQA